jgi:hypothetical protein
VAESSVALPPDSQSWEPHDQLARDNLDAVRRGSRFRSTKRRLCYRQALALVMPRRYLHARDSKADARQDRVFTADEAAAQRGQHRALAGAVEEGRR